MANWLNLFKNDRKAEGDMVSIKIEPNTFLINEGEVKVEETDKPPF